MRARHLIFTTLLMVSACIGQATAQTRTQVQSRFFTSSDGVRLHFLEAGPPDAHVLVFVPGWTMPAWIWTPQLVAFSGRYHVIAFDPRGQGDSDAPSWGYDQDRRARDIADLLTRLEPMPAVVIGWSLGVLDTLAYVHNEGDMRIAGLVLVDNSVGEEPAPVPVRARPRPGPPMSRPVAMHRFVAGMFLDREPAAYIDRLTAATLRTPEAAARELLSYPVPRSYWREAIYSTKKPVLYIVRPHLAAQAANLQLHRPNTETAVFSGAGHALFIDDAARFNALVAGFIRSRIWP
jgi:non-heme chloroperoxidase